MENVRARKRIRKRNCRHCNELYQPDYRNVRHQNYCSKPDCRKASKKAAQQRWLSSDKGRDYFKGPEHCARVRQWRAEHPGYWQRTGAMGQNALQDDSSPQPVSNQIDTGNLTGQPLQDVCFLQPSLIIGVIASLTGNTLQDDIAKTTRRFIDLGQNILNGSSDSQFQRRQS